MNDSLNGQFLQLGETITQINQAQMLSAERLEASLAAAQAIVTNVSGLHDASQTIVERFESYISEMTYARQRDDAFEVRSEQLLEKMHQTSAAQTQYLETLRGQQNQLEAALDQYRLMNQEQSNALGETTQQFKDSSRLLADSYTSFVENITEGLGRALGMFDENMNSMMNTLNQQLNAISDVIGQVPEKLTGADEQYSQQVSTYISSLSKLQQAMTDISAALEKLSPTKEA